MCSIEWCYFQWPWVTLNYAKPPHFLHLYPVYIFILGGGRDINLVGRLVPASPSQQTTNRASNGRGQVMWTIWSLESSSQISGMADARVVKFCIWVGHIKSLHMDDKSPLKDMVRVTWPILIFAASNDISGTAEARIVKFFTQVDGIKSYLSDDKAPP